MLKGAKTLGLYGIAIIGGILPRCSALLPEGSILSASSGFQAPFQIEANILNERLHLSQLRPEDGFMSLNHPDYPAHGIRVKRTVWCDPTVKVYTGYLDVDYGSKHMWFYFFESRHKPDEDDVVMWINGGPGCSSSTGLLMELGPCNIDMNNFSPNGTVWNPYGWNDRANIFFLDQPYVYNLSELASPMLIMAKKIETTEDAAANVASFLSLWFEAFPQFEGRKLHLSGESYGGRYLPVFGSEVVDRNKAATASGKKTLNLQSVIIGNGITDVSTLYEGRYATECGTAALEVPFQDIGTCVRMKTALPRCQAGMQKNCIDSYDEMNCRASVTFCDYELGTAFRESGRNPYDISKPCIGESLCYEEQSRIQDLLNSKLTRLILGVETTDNFTSCSPIVFRDFGVQHDMLKTHTQYYVAGLLDRGFWVLIYAGTYDWQCNWVANHLWTEKLEWGFAEEYKDARMRNWTASVDGEDVVAGKTKTAGGLTFATIYEAGHMVPRDKPVESLTMLNRWLEGKPL